MKFMIFINIGLIAFLWWWWWPIPIGGRVALSSIALALFSLLWLPICMVFLRPHAAHRTLLIVSSIGVSGLLFGLYFGLQYRHPLQSMGIMLVGASLCLGVSVSIGYTVSKIRHAFYSKKRKKRARKGGHSELL